MVAATAIPTWPAVLRNGCVVLRVAFESRHHELLLLSACLVPLQHPARRAMSTAPSLFLVSRSALFVPSTRCPFTETARVPSSCGSSFNHGGQPGVA